MRPVLPQIPSPDLPAIPPAVADAAREAARRAEQASAARGAAEAADAAVQVAERADHDKAVAAIERGKPVPVAEETARARAALDGAERAAHAAEEVAGRARAAALDAAREHAHVWKDALDGQWAQADRLIDAALSAVATAFEQRDQIRGTASWLGSVTSNDDRARRRAEIMGPRGIGDGETRIIVRPNGAGVTARDGLAVLRSLHAAGVLTPAEPHAARVAA